MVQPERNIFIVNPADLTSRRTIGPMRFGVPVGLGVVGSMVEDIRDRNGFKDEVAIEVVDENLRQIVEPQAGDLVLITSFSLTSGRTKTLIRKTIDKGGYAVVGGIHATVRPDDFSSLGAISFMGEAGNSVVFDDLIKEYLHTGNIDKGYNLASEGLSDSSKISLSGLPVSHEIYKALDKNTIIPATFATMGCPHACKHCTVYAGRVVRHRPQEEIIAEIEKRRLDKSGFILSDSNLLPNDYWLSLLGALARKKLSHGWTTEISVNLLAKGGNRLLDALKESQCQRLLVGIESPNKDNLETLGKTHNLSYDVNMVKDIVRKAHDRGIKITGMFIVGFTTDTIDTIRSIEQFIANAKMDSAAIFILTPLPGAELWEELAQQGYFNPEEIDTDDLDLRHLVINHPLGNDQLMWEYRRLCKRVFSAPAVLSRSTRAFFMSAVHHLPENLKQAAISSFGMELVAADEHRKLGLVDFANSVYDTYKAITTCSV